MIWMPSRPAPWRSPIGLSVAYPLQRMKSG